MKKLLLIIPALLLLLGGFIFPKEIYGERCTVNPGGITGQCILAGQECKSLGGYDCTNVYTPLSQKACNDNNGCYEEENCPAGDPMLPVPVIHMHCYTAIMASTRPTDCGMLGNSCCIVPNSRIKPYCNEGYPYYDTSHGSWVISSCTCQNILQDQNPIYCDPAGHPTSSNTGRIYTAIGCIPLKNTNDFLGAILRWAIGIGGGIAFILIIIASFMTMTSAGNPERLKAGQELLVAAISGLILLIFSVFILKIIGVDILNLPGLNL